MRTQVFSLILLTPLLALRFFVHVHYKIDIIVNIVFTGNVLVYIHVLLVPGGICNVNSNLGCKYIWGFIKKHRSFAHLFY